MGVTCSFMKKRKLKKTSKNCPQKKPIVINDCKQNVHTGNCLHRKILARNTVQAENL